MKFNKINILLLLFVSSCSTYVTVPENSNDTFLSKDLYNNQINSIGSLTKLNKSDIDELEKDYMNFSTKALTTDYFKKKLVQLIASDNGITNGSKIVRELKFAQYKTENTIPFKAMCISDPSFYNTITSISQIILERSINPTFDIFIASGNTAPVPTPTPIPTPTPLPTPVSGIINTIAGTGTASFSGDSGQALNATLNGPYTTSVNSSNIVYIADRNNRRIRQVNQTTGIITTFAGSGNPTYNGEDLSAKLVNFDSLYGVASDNSGNVFIADTYRLRIINSSNKANTLYGDGSTGTLYNPRQIAAGNDGFVYIAEYNAGKISKVNISSKVVTTVATINSPIGVAVLFISPVPVIIKFINLLVELKL